MLLEISSWLPPSELFRHIGLLDVKYSWSLFMAATLVDSTRTTERVLGHISNWALLSLRTSYFHIFGPWAHYGPSQLSRQRTLPCRSRYDRQEGPTYTRVYGLYTETDL